MAIIPPKYATWLLIAEAIPENSTGADAKAVAVNGGTVRLSPKPRTRTPGRTAVVNPAAGARRLSSTNATPTRTGPNVIAIRGPRCRDQPPIVLESSSIIPVTGNRATPAWSAE